MKALNERISEWPHLAVSLTVLEICLFKVQKTGHFLRKISPL